MPQPNGQLDHEDLEPVDHDPFPDETLMKAMAVLMQRQDAVEQGMVQALAEIHAKLDTLAAGMAHVHQTNDELHRTIRTPRRIVRDEDGRPTHLEIDQGG